MLAKFIPYHDLKRADVARALGVNLNRVANLINGVTYPTPDECDALEKLFDGLPAQVLFDHELLEYRFNWPPPRGMAKVKAELERLREKAGE